MLNYVAWALKLFTIDAVYKREKKKVAVGGKPVFNLILTPAIQAPRPPLSNPSLTPPPTPPILLPTPRQCLVLQF